MAVRHGSTSETFQIGEKFGILLVFISLVSVSAGLSIYLFSTGRDDDMTGQGTLKLILKMVMLNGKQ